ncbi:hypothetical protein BVY02_01470 [bacterium J17]|nr:hypothetical protein BVY02_01470 [bacterium J17]
MNGAFASSLVDSDFLNSLSESDVLVKRDVSASSISTFGVGGTISQLYVIRSLNGACDLLKKLNDRRIDYRVLGAGSNLVLPDEGIAEPVLILGQELSQFLFLGDETVSPLRAEEFLNNAQSIMPQPVELGRSYRVLVFAAA